MLTEILSVVEEVLHRSHILVEAVRGRRQVERLGHVPEAPQPDLPQAHLRLEPGK